MRGPSCQATSTRRCLRVTCAARMYRSAAQRELMQSCARQLCVATTLAPAPCSFLILLNARLRATTRRTQAGGAAPPTDWSKLTWSKLSGTRDPIGRPLAAVSSVIFANSSEPIEASEQFYSQDENRSTRQVPRNAARALSDAVRRRRHDETADSRRHSTQETLATAQAVRR